LVGAGKPDLPLLREGLPLNESPEFVALFGWTAQWWPGIGWRQSVPRRYWLRAGLVTAEWMAETLG
jgi:hypothetical protein